MASGAEMKQHGMRQVSYDTEVGKITTDCRVVGIHDGFRMRCALHEESLLDTEDDGKELDMIRSGVFFVAASPSTLFSREASTLELNPTTAAEVEQAALSREHAVLGTPGPAAEATLDGEGEPAVRIKVPTTPATPSVEERALHEASGHVLYRSWCQWCIAARVADKPHLRGQMKPCQELSLTSRISDERRIKYCQFLPSTQSMLVPRASQQHFVPRKHSVSNWWKRILAFVEALGHNVVMLHSDREPVLVQLLKAVQSRRVKRTLVRHGPRASHQSQGKNENANQVINGVCRAMWLSLEDFLREKLPSDIILTAWLIRHAAWCLTRFQVKDDGRTAFVRVFGKAYTKQVLPFGERVMYKYTSSANRQSGSEVGPWNLGWEGANDRRTHHSHGKWGPESDIVAPRASE